jgi:hypothetical protein
MCGELKCEWEFDIETPVSDGTRHWLNTAASLTENSDLRWEEFRESCVAGGGGYVVGRMRYGLVRVGYCITAPKSSLNFGGKVLRLVVVGRY